MHNVALFALLRFLKLLNELLENALVTPITTKLSELLSHRGHVRFSLGSLVLLTDARIGSPVGIQSCPC